MKHISNILLGLSAVIVLLTFALPGHPPDFFKEYMPNWFQYPPIWLASATIFLAAILTRKIRKEEPYPFIPAVLFFFGQTFFAFGPLTPFPLVLVLLFTGFYHLFVIEKKKA